ncbi:hypothetical protein BO71DRAFT_424824 [Aspergillus ellipticus CBS 707.79]|uniref:NWD NACHT-NTPase N-terminal domain-containing protein n=1 Tax=Aspergillus ellipticus CBS 707.79 TaxID=1448320 RepID=A0A319F460_9EURO|nr:hypothetical protein BO71DRAFT_424824 [Aspergillus ellipticus CBS 707.79]
MAGLGATLREGDQLDEGKHFLVDRYMSDQAHGLPDSSSFAWFHLQAERLIANAPQTDQPTGEAPELPLIPVEVEERKFLEAMREYENDVDNKARNLGESSLGEHSGILEGWLGLIPSESNYLSTICGGIKLVLHAASRMKDIREDILSALCDIPVILNGAQRVLGIYKVSNELRVYNDALYTATLRGLGCLLGYIRERGWKKSLKALLLQSSFGKRLSESIEEMHGCRDRFNAEADICGMPMQQRLETLMREANQNTVSLRADMMKIQYLATTEQLRSQQWIEESTQAI